MSALKKRAGCSLAREKQYDLVITIDKNIIGKMIVFAKVETDRGNLYRFMYSKSSHADSIASIERQLKPKRFITITMTADLGESNVKAEID